MFEKKLCRRLVSTMINIVGAQSTEPVFFVLLLGLSSSHLSLLVREFFFYLTAVVIFSFFFRFYPHQIVRTSRFNTYRLPVFGIIRFLFDDLFEQQTACAVPWPQRADIFMIEMNARERCKPNINGKMRNFCACAVRLLSARAVNFISQCIRCYDSH